jgi:hypothetical protein
LHEHAGSQINLAALRLTNCSSTKCLTQSDFIACEGTASFSRLSRRRPLLYNEPSSYGGSAIFCIPRLDHDERRRPHQATVIRD